MGFLSGVIDESVTKLIEVMVTQFRENTKTYLIVYFIGSPGELLKFTEVQTLPKTK